MTEITTGTHTLTYVSSSEQSIPWTVTMATCFSNITTYLDNVDVTKLSFIEDSGVGYFVEFVATASAANYWNIANGATGSAPVLSMAGSDTNVSGLLRGKGSGSVKLDLHTLPYQDGASGQLLKTNGSGTIGYLSGIISDVVEDTAPQLGGDLDTLARSIVSAGSASLNLSSVSDLDFKLGDASGSKVYKILSSGDTSVSTINSDGDLAVVDLVSNSLSVVVPLALTQVDINSLTSISALAVDDLFLISDVSEATNVLSTGPAIFGNGFQYLGSFVGTNATSIIADLETDIYSSFKIIGSNITPGTSNTYLQGQLRNSAGDFVTAYTYGFRIRDSNGYTDSFTQATRGSSKLTFLSDDNSHFSTTAAGCVFIWIAAAHSSSFKTVLSWNGHFNQVSGEVCSARGTGKSTVDYKYTGLKFSMNSGTITGTFHVYGLVNI